MLESHELVVFKVERNLALERFHYSYKRFMIRDNDARKTVVLLQSLMPEI